MEPKVIDLKRHVDDRGDLCELWRLSWDLMGSELNNKIASRMPLRQVYAVHDNSPYVVRAYHRHEHLWDLFHIVSGSAKFHVVKGPAKFDLGEDDDLLHEDAEHKIVTLSDRKPQLLVVPPLYWHGWMSLEPGTTLISLASHEYVQPPNTDERRIPYGSFDEDLGEYVWKVAHK